MEPTLATVPQNQVILLLHQAILPQHQATMPQNPVILPQHPATLPQHPAILLQHQAILPQDQAIMPQLPAILPQNQAIMDPVRMATREASLLKLLLQIMIIKDGDINNNTNHKLETKIKHINFLLIFCFVFIVIQLLFVIKYPTM